MKVLTILWRQIASFARQHSGAAAVEFALVIWPLLSFISLVFLVAIYHFTLQSFDFATRSAARLVMTGTVPANAQSASSFRDKTICPQILLPIPCELIVVNAYKVQPTSDATKGTGIYQFINTATMSLNASTGDASFCLGGPGDLVFLDVTYTIPNFLGGLFTSSAATQQGFLIRSTAFFRNEPYQAQGPAC